jgi:hypothetical protein
VFTLFTELPIFILDHEERSFDDTRCLFVADLFFSQMDCLKSRRCLCSWRRRLTGYSRRTIRRHLSFVIANPKLAFITRSPINWAKIAQSWR